MPIFYGAEVELVDTPYKYFKEWKYDTEIFRDVDWVAYNCTINEKREDVLEEESQEAADFSLDIVNWIFGIYIVFYLLFSARRWLYKK